MTDEFVPSPSVDSYTTPMDVQIPLLDPSEYQNDVTNNTTSKSDRKKPQSTSTIEKITGNYNQPPSAPQIVQPLENESNATPLSEKLFPIAQLKRLEFYQALLSEYLGTLLLTLVCTSVGLPVTRKHVPDLHGALASGFIVATLIVCFGHTSGSHINPAVTISFLVVAEIDIIRGLCYIGMQLLGAFTASSLLESIAPFHAHGNLGMTTITEGITLSQAFVIEFIITFILCYTVHAICDRRRDDIGGSKALAVGLAITIGCLFGGPYTGGSMNPARSFGPASVMNSWENHWIYWAGPLSGAIVAALIYSIALRKPTAAVVRTDSSLRLNADKTNHI